MSDIPLLRPAFEEFMKELNDSFMSSTISSSHEMPVSELFGLAERLRSIGERTKACSERALFDIIVDEVIDLEDELVSHSLAPFEPGSGKGEPDYELTLDTIFDDYIYPVLLPPASQLPLTLGLLVKVLEEGQYEQNDFVMMSFPHDFPIPSTEQQMAISMARLQAVSDRLQAWTGSIKPQYIPPEKKVRRFDAPFDPDSHKRPVGELLMLIPGRIHELLNFMPDGTDVTAGEHKETVALADKLAAWIERNHSGAPDASER